MSAYQRKTRDEYDIESYYPGAGWSLETCEATRRDAVAQLRTYRDNCPGLRLRIVKRRVRIEAPA